MLTKVRKRKEMENILHDCKRQQSFEKAKRKTNARNTLIKNKTMHYS